MAGEQAGVAVAGERGGGAAGGRIAEVASAGEGGAVLIAPPVMAIQRLEPQIFGRHYREKYRHFIRKSLYFVVREGPLATLRKIRSKRLERAIEAELAIVVAAIEVEGRSYIGVTRELGGAPVFDARLVFPVAAEAAPTELVLSEASRLALESYLPVPSCPFPEGLVEALLAENPFLERSGEGTGLERFVVGGARGGGAAGGEGGGVGGGGVAGAGSARATVAGTPTSIQRSALRARGGRPASERGGVYLLGFGGYIREQVLRHFRGDVVMALDYRAELIRRVGAPVPEVTDSFERVLARLAEDAAPLVIISTYHSDHCWMALRVLDANPGARVFIEKPPVVGWEGLEELLARRWAGAWIDVGFNRRYAPLLTRVRTETAALPRPLVMTALVKELKIPPTHWYLWPNQGTRITGNVCHWLDLAYHLIGGEAKELTLAETGDTVTLAVLFGDGSLATIVATDVGDDLPGVTERIEVRGGETTIVLDDFRRLEVASARGRMVRRRLRREKGHGAMYGDLRRRWLEGGPPRYPLEDLYWVPALTARASALLREGGRHSWVKPMPPALVEG